MAKETDQTTVRIPKALALKVRALAIKKQSTVSRQAVYLIEKALGSEDITDFQ